MKTFTLIFSLAIFGSMAYAQDAEWSLLRASVCQSGMDANLEIEVQPLYFCAKVMDYERGPYIESACISADAAKNVFVLTSMGMDVGGELSPFGPSYDFFTKDDLSASLSGSNPVYEDPSSLTLMREKFGRSSVAIKVDKEALTASFYETGEEITLSCEAL